MQKCFGEMGSPTTCRGSPQGEKSGPTSPLPKPASHPLRILEGRQPFPLNTWRLRRERGKAEVQSPHRLSLAHDTCAFLRVAGVQLRTQQLSTWISPPLFILEQLRLPSTRLSVALPGVPPLKKRHRWQVFPPQPPRFPLLQGCVPLRCNTSGTWQECTVCLLGLIRYM